MVSAALMGGLGNQMFQIAAAHALALRNNDISGFNFRLCNTPMQGNPSEKYLNNIFSKINNDDRNKVAYVYVEHRFGFRKIDYHKDMIINGYFQSEKYFDDYKEEIINLFNLSGEDKAKVQEFFLWWGVLDKPITAVHIRRGDYLKNPDFHPVCTLEYYQKAMEEIGDSYFVFISDDMDWVKENFKGKDYVFSTFNDEILDLTLMSMCDNNIIANSSFSWWGAYLNQNKTKKVIAPKKWFGPLGPKDSGDIIPKNWIII